MSKVSYVSRRESLTKSVLRSLGTTGFYYGAFVFLGPALLLVAVTAVTVGVELLMRRVSKAGRLLIAFEREPGRWKVYQGDADTARRCAKAAVMDQVQGELDAIYRRAEMYDAT